MKITHFPGCTANYPEKPVGERPQHIVKIDIGDGEVVHQCSDCGAFIIVQSIAEKSNAPVDR